MNYISQTRDDILIEKLNIKRATAKEAEEFKKHISNEINSGFKRVIIDCTKCEFMDSSFLGNIIAVYKKISESNGELKLIVSEQNIRILLEITSINKFIQVYETKREAVESFNKESKANS